MTINFITKEEFLIKTIEMQGSHWKSNGLEYRWDYHSKALEIIKNLNLTSPSSILEIGTMGIQVVTDSHTMDFDTGWDFDGKDPTYFHDARSVPWNIGNKKYEVVIALRVFQHLTPNQKEAFLEAKRISKKLIIVVDEKYSIKGHENSKGISLTDFIEWNDGEHPSSVIETKMGNLFFWDFLDKNNY